MDQKFYVQTPRISSLWSQYMIVTASDFHCTLHDSPPLRTRDDLRQFSLKNLKGFAELKVNFIQSEIIPGVIFAEERLEEEEDGRVEDVLVVLHVHYWQYWPNTLLNDMFSWLTYLSPVRRLNLGNRNLNINTGWHIRLVQTSRWHQKKSSVLAWPSLT